MSLNLENYVFNITILTYNWRNHFLDLQYLVHSKDFEFLKDTRSTVKNPFNQM